ncbi:hypothetical protein CYMTET_34760 [Cymbomonas tetramitiformis]|uniref:Uncharacterized protein n=1 Tax=Cymbomonas tetramitiformis TaxID=36881 RepID=A0AAE0FAL3_9CHLO|nr:hypothetical protein CYMTET_34760 [Cymbomonas tetramitiformis]
MGRMTPHSPAGTGLAERPSGQGWMARGEAPGIAGWAGHAHLAVNMILNLRHLGIDHILLVADSVDVCKRIDKYVRCTVRPLVPMDGVQCGEVDALRQWSRW